MTSLEVHWSELISGQFLVKDLFGTLVGVILLEARNAKRLSEMTSICI